MKIHLSVTAALLLIAGVAFAETATYQCNAEFGSPVILAIKQAPRGSFFDLSATFTAPSKDPTTGTLLRSKAMSFSGSADTIDGVRVFQLNENSNPRHQVFAEIKNKGQKATLSEVRLNGNSSPSEKTRTCTVTSFAK